MFENYFLCCIGFITLYIITQKLKKKERRNEKMRIKKGFRFNGVSRNETTRTNATFRPNR